MKKIAMFGGTFNPIHMGHLNIAEGFLKGLGLDKIIFVPTSIPPHKSYEGNVSAYDRFKMCELATENFAKFEVSDIEINRDGPSYTVTSLEKFHNIYPNDEIYLIVGADMFLTLQSWYKADNIFKLAIVCVAPRDDIDIKILCDHAQKLGKLGARTRIVNVPLFNISSTEVRDKARLGKKLDGLVPKNVEEYIYEKKLYME